LEKEEKEEISIALNAGTVLSFAPLSCRLPWIRKRWKASYDKGIEDHAGEACRSQTAADQSWIGQKNPPGVAAMEHSCSLMNGRTGDGRSSPFSFTARSRDKTISSQKQTMNRAENDMAIRWTNEPIWRVKPPGEILSGAKDLNYVCNRFLENDMAFVGTNHDKRRKAIQQQSELAGQNANPEMLPSPLHLLAALFTGQQALLRRFWPSWA